MTTFQAEELQQQEEEALHADLGNSLATTLSSGSGVETTSTTSGGGGGSGSPFSSFVLSFDGDGPRGDGALAHRQ